MSCKVVALTIVMSHFSNQSPKPQNATKASARLTTIKDHMEGSSPTVFTSDHVPQAPEDPLFGLMAAYRKDTFEKKVDLGIGAYRDDNAKPWVLPVVKQVSHEVQQPASLKLTIRRLTRFCEKTRT